MLTFFLLSTITKANAQKINITGKVLDAETQLPIENATVQCNRQGTFTDVEGFFNLIDLPSGNVSIKVKYVGYLVAQQNLNLLTDTTLTIQLQPFTTFLDTVVITGIKKIEPSLNTLSKTQIATIPSIGSERDILRMMTLIPGIKSDNDGGAGIYVRGGSADQNLFLFGGATVYKNSHLLGFFSPFNSDVIESVDVYKGGFPSKFGGRLSSVLDIKLKTANWEKFSVSGSLGIITSRISLELPIIQNRFSILLAARRSYFNVFTKLFSGSGTNETPDYYFYDLDGVANLRIGKKAIWQVFNYKDKDHLTAKGDDDLEKNKYQQNWNSNITGSSFFVPIANKIQNLTECYLSRYLMNLQVDRTREEDEYRIDFKSLISDLTFRNTTDIEISTHFSTQLGLSYSTFKSSPSNLVYFFNQTAVAQTNLNVITAKQMSFWIDNTLKFKSWKAVVGFRNDTYKADNQLYNSIQPRFKLNHQFNDKLALSASYAKMFQPLHLLSNVGLGFPVDIWLSSQKGIKPQFSDQFTLGVLSETETLTNGKIQKWKFSAELYYKEMKNIISYKDGYSSNDFTEFNQNKAKDLSEIMTTGRGLSYGLELMIEKKSGNWNGWISYTLSKTNHQFEVLNGGELFPARQDQRHHLSIVNNITLSKRWSFNTTWSFLTGQAITLPSAVYSFPAFDFSANRFQNFSNLSYVNGQRNSFRMATYHRLDVGIQRQTTHKWGVGTLELSIFNAYNRRNPYFYYLSNGQSINSVSLFGFVPSIGYSFKIYSK